MLGMSYLYNRCLLLILLAGLTVRLILSPLPGNPGDMAINQSWMHSAAELGMRASFEKQLDHPQLPNYGPVGIFLYYAMGKLYQATISPPYYIIQPYHRIFAKLPSVAADLGICLLLYTFFKRTKGQSAGLIASAIFAFQPAVLYDSAVWGQTDSIVMALSLASLYSIQRNRIGLGCSLLALACLDKPQALIFIPLFLFILPRTPETYVRAFCASTTTVLLVLAPFVTSGNIHSALGSTLDAIGFGPRAKMSSFAYNLWWGIFGSDAFKHNPTERVFSMITYHHVGLMLFACAYLLLLFLLRKPWKSTPQNEDVYWLCAAYISYSFFLFPTGILERYLYPFLVLGIPLVFRNVKNAVMYALVSLAILSNIFLVLPPANWSAPFFKNKWTGTVISVFLIINYFVLLLPTILSEIRRAAGKIPGLPVVATGQSPH